MASCGWRDFDACSLGRTESRSFPCLSKCRQLSVAAATPESGASQPVIFDTPSVTHRPYFQLSSHIRRLASLASNIDRTMAVCDCRGASGCGGIGRRPGFRFQCREACRFDSYHPHHFLTQTRFPNGPCGSVAPVFRADASFSLSTNVSGEWRAAWPFLRRALSSACYYECCRGPNRKALFLERPSRRAVHDSSPSAIESIKSPFTAGCIFLLLSSYKKFLRRRHRNCAHGIEGRWKHSENLPKPLTLRQFSYFSRNSAAPPKID